MGMFDFLSQGNGILSGTPNAAPANWQNLAGLFGATAKDVGANIQGDPSANNIGMFGRQQQAGASQRLGQQAQQAIADAGSDPIKLKAAIMAYTAAGGDPTQFIAAAKFGQPTVQHVGNSLVSIDPTNNAPTEIYHSQPLPTPNQAFNPDGTPNMAFQNYQKGLYRARAQATADFRAPPRAPVGSPLGNPASLFGGR